MKINNENPIAGIKGGSPASESGTVGVPASAPGPTDKVSLEESQHAAQVADNARVAAQRNRTARLHALEEQVRRGDYKPNPSRVVEEILAAADVELRLREMIGG
jgi:anti-sigma28 factor (negative regulator of flagellin synthesis)